MTTGGIMVLTSIALTTPTETRTMLVTGYCAGTPTHPCTRCCGPAARAVTASGMPAAGRLVAAPRWLPFGARVRVPGYGLAPVLDRGGAIRGNRLDLLFPTHQAALNWGARKLRVEVLR